MLLLQRHLFLIGIIFCMLSGSIPDESSLYALELCSGFLNRDLSTHAYVGGLGITSAFLFPDNFYE